MTPINTAASPTGPEGDFKFPRLIRCEGESKFVFKTLAICQRPAGCKLEIKLAGIGQRWLEVKRTMRIEYIAGLCQTLPNAAWKGPLVAP